jgi:hypothetical protein
VIGSSEGSVRERLRRLALGELSEIDALTPAVLAYVY